MLIVKIIWWFTLIGALVTFILAQIATVTKNKTLFDLVTEQHLFNDAKTLSLLNIAISSGVIIGVLKV